MLNSLLGWYPLSSSLSFCISNVPRPLSPPLKPLPSVFDTPKRHLQRENQPSDAQKSPTPCCFASYRAQASIRAPDTGSGLLPKHSNRTKPLKYHHVYVRVLSFIRSDFDVNLYITPCDTFNNCVTMLTNVGLWLIWNSAATSTAGLPAFSSSSTLFLSATLSAVLAFLIPAGWPNIDAIATCKFSLDPETVMQTVSALKWKCIGTESLHVAIIACYWTGRSAQIRKARTDKLFSVVDMKKVLGELKAKYLSGFV